MDDWLASIRKNPKPYKRPRATQLARPGELVNVDDEWPDTPRPKKKEKTIDSIDSDGDDDGYAYGGIDDIDVDDDDDDDDDNVSTPTAKQVEIIRLILRQEIGIASDDMVKNVIFSLSESDVNFETVKEATLAQAVASEIISAPSLEELSYAPSLPPKTAAKLYKNV